MRPGPLIVLFGISGAGKSYLSRKISTCRPDILCLSAGVLLKDALAEDPEQLRTANRDVILSNQMILADAVRTARHNRWEDTVLLEAHSVIDNDRELIEVPFDAMRAIQIAGIILIEERVSEIMRRRDADMRFRPARGLRELEDQQQLSDAVAYKYADAVSAPIQKISSEDFKTALDFIDTIEQSNWGSTHSM
ncbi:AAA family ATPase [Methylorubrum extorquens]